MRYTFAVLIILVVIARQCDAGSGAPPEPYPEAGAPSLDEVSGSISGGYSHFSFSADDVPYNRNGAYLDAEITRRLPETIFVAAVLRHRCVSGGVDA
jgi:hypothetical protein